MVDDQWSLAGANILSDDRLKSIQQILERAGPVIVEHRLYRGASAPKRIVFDEYADFLAYLQTDARPGDSFLLWNYSALCRDENTEVSGKYPDTSGRVPQTGAY